MHGCCIVETRPFANLDKLIIDDHLRYVPEDWGLTIYCSKANEHLIQSVDFGRDTQIIVIPEAFSIDDYNNLFKSVSFWESLPYDKVLIFQTDSKLLRHGIEDFVEYDYVGAPWKFQQHGGNGGLSLRSVEIMTKICKIARFSTRNEDVLFCNFMETNGFGKLAPRDICSQFSVESIYALGSLGCHGIDKWLSKQEQNNILTQYK